MVKTSNNLSKINSHHNTQQEDGDSICDFFIKQIYDCKDISIDNSLVNSDITMFPGWKRPIERIIDLNSNDLFSSFISNSLKKSIDFISNDSNISSSLSIHDKFKSSSSQMNTIVISNVFIRNLLCLSQFSKPSCYLQFTVMGSNVKSKTRNETLHPSWSDEVIELSFTGDISHNMNLFVTLFYKGLILSDDKIGLIKIPLSSLLIEPIDNMSYNFDFTIFKKAMEKAQDESKHGFDLPQLYISIKKI